MQPPLVPYPQKNANNLVTKLLTLHLVNPWGVEPQSKEPESFILSIKLRVPEKWSPNHFRRNFVQN